MAELRRETVGNRRIVTPPDTSDLYTSETSDDLSDDEEVSDEPLSRSPYSSLFTENEKAPLRSQESSSEQELEAQSNTGGCQVGASSLHTATC